MPYITLKLKYDCRGAILRGPDCLHRLWLDQPLTALDSLGLSYAFTPEQKAAVEKQLETQLVDGDFDMWLTPSASLPFTTFNPHDPEVE